MTSLPSLQRKNPGPSGGPSLRVRLCPGTRRTTAGGRRPQADGPGRSTFFTLGQQFTQLRNTPGNAWLKNYNYEIVRYACRYMGDDYAAFFDPDRPDHG